MAQQHSELKGRPSRKSQAGQATVELALALGLVLLLVLAALDFGRAFFSYIGLINAAREGARRGVMTGSAGAIEPAVRQEIQGSTLIDATKLTVQYNWGGSGQPLVVSLSYRFDLIVLGFLPYSYITLSTSATMAIP